MLPRLRTHLDFFPSPVPDQPGLVIRDPFQYSDATLIIPPGLIASLEYFDGAHSSLDLHEYLFRETGDLQVSKLEQHLLDTLSNAGFLEDDVFEQRKLEAERAFAESPIREAAHAGSGYPDEKSELIRTFNDYLGGAPKVVAPKPLIAIAAPHVSPFGGVESYRAAYNALSPADAERTFVILGTLPLRTTRLPRPHAQAVPNPVWRNHPDIALIDEILAKSGFCRRDGRLLSLHRALHRISGGLSCSTLFGPKIRIVPILCGSYANSIYRGGTPESKRSCKSDARFPRRDRRS